MEELLPLWETALGLRPRCVRALGRHRALTSGIQVDDIVLMQIINIIHFARL